MRNELIKSDVRCTYIVAHKVVRTYFPHQSSSVVVSSLTTRLSLGERPVLAPDRVAKAPLDVINDPCSYFMACSYNSVTNTEIIRIESSPFNLCFVSR